MSLFFGILNKIFSSELTIPIFQNKGEYLEKAILIKLKPKNSEWIIESANNYKRDKNFFYIKSSEISNEDIFFIATHEDLKKFDSKKLISYNNFTSSTYGGYTYRSNLRIKIENGGFSSYQAEYPFKMTKAKGSVITSISSVTNINADKNYIFFKNIFELPIHEKFKIFIVDLKEKKIKTIFEAKTNYSNIFELKKEYILPEMFLVTDKYIGIPIYISEKDGHLSMEHTNPPISSILNADRVQIASKFKKELYEIINK